MGTGRLILLGLLLAVLAGLGAVLALRPLLPVSVSENQVSAQIAERLPKRIEKGALTVTILSMRPDFSPGDTADNRVGLAVLAEIGGLGLAVRADAEASGRLDYREGAFYLAEVTVGKVALLPAPDAGPVSGGESGGGLAGALLGAIGGQLDKHLGGAAGGADLTRLLERADPRILKAVGGVVEGYLAETPVYVLSDRGLAGSLAAETLVDITFTETTAVARFDTGGTLPRMLIVAAIVIGVLCIAALAFRRRRA